MVNRKLQKFNPYIQFENRVENWQTAIQLAASPLLVNEIIEERYIDAMIQNVIDHGEYIVLLPKVAMPHARPEAGAKSTGVSILKLENPVSFGQEADVLLIICLATKSSAEHLNLLSQISILIDDEEKVEKLLKIKEKEEFIEVANKMIEMGESKC